MADQLKVNSSLQIPMSEFQFSFARSGGPGGQNVNKVNTKAMLRWNVRSSTSLPVAVRGRFIAANANRITKDGDFVIDSQRYRDQGRNVSDCLEKLRELLAIAAVRPKQRRKTKPTRGSIKRRLKAKQQKSEKKSRRRDDNVH